MKSENENCDSGCDSDANIVVSARSDMIWVSTQFENARYSKIFNR